MDKVGMGFAVIIALFTTVAAITNSYSLSSHNNYVLINCFTILLGGMTSGIFLHWLMDKYVY